MKRLVIVYNPRSTRFSEVEENVIEPARHLRGWMVAKYEVVKTSVDDNSRKLANILTDDDLVVAAGGDGTATIAMNGVMLTKAQNVKFGAMGFGNFNDTARALDGLSFEEIVKTEAREVWPLQCAVNGKHWRYSLCYITIGMFAEACNVFEGKTVRKTLRKGKKSLFYSLRCLVGWWLKEHRKAFLPSFSLGDASGDSVEMAKTSDYLAINSPTVARIMKGEKLFENNKEFLCATGELNRFWKMAGFMTKAVFKRIPAEKTEYDSLKFSQPANLTIQAEGELVHLENVSKVEIRKASKPLLAIMRAKDE